MTTPVNNGNSNGRPPFYNPWGVWGYLWRTLLFLSSIVLLCLLFANLRQCDSFRKDKDRDKDEDDIEFRIDPLNPYRRPVPPPGWDTIRYNPGIVDGPYRELPPDIRDDRPVEGWGRPIQGVPELPDPIDNRIPPVDPFDSTRVVPNPIDTMSRVVADQLIVLFNSTDLRGDMASFARQFKQHYPSDEYRIAYYNADAGTMLLSVPKEELVQVMEDLPRKITDIDFRVTLNEIMEEAFTPSDPGFRSVSYDEYYKLIQAYDAWDVTKGSADVKVAIVDSYFDLTNPEIGSRYVDPISIPTKTKNVLPPRTAPRDPMELGAYCHGTHVAGLAVGGQNNNFGCSGIAPECSWIPISIGMQLTMFNVFEGILYAVYHDADVVNISIGKSFGPYSNSNPDARHLPIDDQIDCAERAFLRGADLWEYVYKVANDHKCIIVTAAGNDNFLSGMDPMKRSDNVVKVEAVDNEGIKADFSNFGIVEEENLDYSTVAAPGVNLWSATPKSCVPYWKAIENQTHMKSSREGLVEMSGTSMASPVVAGAVALLKSKNKDLTNEEVISILLMTSKQTDPSNTIGPTIQIRDALDATGGEKANFDDLMRDHNKLIGKWKITEPLELFHGETGHK